MIALCMVSHGAMIHQPTLSQIVQKIEFFSKGNPFQIPMLFVSTISRKEKGLLKRENGDQIKGNNVLLRFFWRICFLKKKKFRLWRKKMHGWIKVTEHLGDQIGNIKIQKILPATAHWKNIDLLSAPNPSPQRVNSWPIWSVWLESSLGLVIDKMLPPCWVLAIYMLSPGKVHLLRGGNPLVLENGWEALEWR